MSDHKPAPDPNLPRVLRTSPHDRLVWKRTVAESERLRERSAEASARLPSAPSLMADLFASFYRADVRPDPLADSEDPITSVHRPIIERMLAGRGYVRLHAETSGRLNRCVLAVDAITARLAAHLDPEVGELIADELHDAAEQERLERSRDYLRELDARKARPQRTVDPKDPLSLSMSERRARLAEIEKELAENETERKADYERTRAWSRLADHVREIGIPEAIASAELDIERFERALDVWSADPAAEPSVDELDLDERLALFRKLSGDPNLRAATELLGRFRIRASTIHRTLAPAAPLAIAGLDRGADLARLVPSELILLAEPALAMEFSRRYAEEELALYRLEVRGEPNRGPVVVCLDESSSMKGERDLYAKAIALAVIGIANADQRDGLLIRFSGPGYLKEVEFPADRPDPRRAVEVFSSFLGGGTDFDGPLVRALARTASGRLSSADCLMVTDGEGLIDPGLRARIMAARDERGFRLFLVGVGVGPGPFAGLTTKVWDRVELVADAENLLDGLITALHPTPISPHEAAARQ